MAKPDYIVTPYYYRNTAVDDVQDIMDDLATLLPANGWSVPATDTYQTPADPNGRFFKIALVRSSNTRLLVTMTDDMGRSTAQRAMQISGTSIVDYFYGSRYVHVYNMSGTDGMWASLLSLAPESETVHDRYCALHTDRDSAGNPSGNSTLYATVINGATNSYSTVAAGSIISTRSGGMKSLFSNYSGGRRWFPLWLSGNHSSGSYMLRGRLYNTMCIAKDLVTTGMEETIPIDEATTGVFKVTCTDDGSWDIKLAVRKS